MSAPLTIDGFTYLRSLGQFSLGDSYVYREDASGREVHVMIARSQQSVDDFIASFEDALGGEQPGLILYAGLTDRERPYLITDFLAAEPPKTGDQSDLVAGDAEEPLDDETVLVARAEFDDATRLSAPKRAPSGGAVPADDATIVRPRTVPSVKAIEDPVYAPALILDEAQRRYAPRTPPAQGPAPRSVTEWTLPASTVSRGRGRSIREAEQRRARGLLAAVVGSVLFSTLASLAAIIWLLSR